MGISCLQNASLCLSPPLPHQRTLGQQKMDSVHWTDGLPLKIVNVIVSLLFSGSNIYTVVSPHSVYWDIKQTYITPADWAFFIWPIIHFLLLGTVICQFTAHAKVVIIDGISWWFPLLTIFNIILVTARANHYYTVAFGFSLLAASTVGRICTIVKWIFFPSIANGLFVHLPFSLWRGWAIFLVFLTAFEAFDVDASEHHAGVRTIVSVWIAL